MKHYWFVRKRYGWGWRPSSWQGWSLTVLYIAVVVIAFRTIDVASHSGSDTLIGFAPLLIALTAIYSLLCFLTGESPRWQWGKDTGTHEEK